jgi:penicillin-binding protein 1B
MDRNANDTQEPQGLRPADASASPVRLVSNRVRQRLGLEIRQIRVRYARHFVNVSSKLAASLRFIRAHRSLEVALAVGASVVLLILASLTVLMVRYWFVAGNVASVPNRSPSRLYGAPLTFEKGKPFDAASVERALQDCHYRQARRPGVAYGTYRLEDDGTLLVGLRRYPAVVDGFQGDATLKITHEKGVIASIQVDGIETDARSIPLEPPLIATYYGPDLRDSRWVDLDRVPPHVIAAILAAEDADFMDHNGISVSGIVRAGWTNVRAGEIRQGGSTITQQLVKNLLDWKERTLWRKAREVLVAILIETRFEKPRILEAYLNEIYFGTSGSINLIGIGSASRAYFGKDVVELTVDEAAVLAGMIPSPGRYSPVKNPSVALERRNHVLDRMLDAGSITEVEHRIASETPIRVIEEKLGRNLAPYFARQVVREAARRWGIHDLHEGSYLILSSLDLEDQRAADRAVVDWLEVSGRENLQGALVSVDPKTGEVLAWVGGRDFDESEFDRVASARRQLGSLFKPIVYASALERSELYPFDFVDDSPIAVRFDDEMWIPKNSDRRFRGRTTLRDALELSLNVPTVKVAVRNGLDPIVDLAGRMGIEAPMEPVPSLALGTVDATPLEVASVYATIAGDGVRRPIRGIREIVDASRVSVTPVVEEETVRVLDERGLVYLRSLLHGVVTRGTGWSVSRLGLGPAVAGKTGTSSDERDAWFAGFTPDRTTVVWVGYDDARPTRLSGAKAALPIWGSFMKSVRPSLTTNRWQLPPGYEYVSIDPSTGALAGELCPTRRTEIYPDALRPGTECGSHKPKQSWFTRLLAHLPDDDPGRDEATDTRSVERPVTVEREMRVNGISIIDLSSNAIPLAAAREEAHFSIAPLEHQSPERTAAAPPGGR